MTKSLDELLLLLEKKYSIVQKIDLYQCEQNHNLISELSLLKNYAFESNQRLIVIADNKLQRSFHDQPANLLTTFQQQVKYLNLAHDFIIILSNIESIVEDINYLHKTYYYQESHAINQIFKFK